MRVLIFHGYLLRGTGSNVYNAELAAALVRARARGAPALPGPRSARRSTWVDAAGDWDGGALERRRRAASRCARPSTGPTSAACCRSTSPTATRASRRGRSPTSPRPSSTRYLERNVAAVREVAERARPDVALANHLVMGPLILARALRDGVPYAVKIHGSALEYTVKPHPRFLPVRARGPRGRARGARRLAPHRARACGRRWTTRACAARTRLGPPGVDVARFAPREPEAAARAACSGLRARCAADARARRATDSSFARDPASAAAALATIEPGATASSSSSAS